jgi:zinc and cadmium transporter
MPSINTSFLGLLAIYSITIVAASLLGGWLPKFIRFTHTRMQTLISLVGGLMLGIAVFHLLPHAVHELGSERLGEISWAVMLGMIVMFFMLRFFHFHNHDEVDFSDSKPEEASIASLPKCDHDHTHDHGSHAHHHDHSHATGLSWIGVLVGLGFHTLLDGVALVSTMQVEANHAHGQSALLGFGVFLAILLHKPLDAMSITSLMRAQGASSGKCALINILFSSMVPVGAMLVLLFGSFSGTLSQSIAGWGLAFSAGVFLCIALSDLLPEMEFHSHNRVRLSLALMIGIILAWAIGFLEPAHLHEGGNHEHHSHTH